ncbi:MAG TPA: hypothetical protein VMT62_03025 [Syntrophorhabdaceae bacterium]|nr:hypothetical protein [Syntrophorhabdaceae bacterium]
MVSQGALRLTEVSKSVADGLELSATRTMDPGCEKLDRLRLIG